MKPLTPENHMGSSLKNINAQSLLQTKWIRIFQSGAQHWYFLTSFLSKAYVQPGLRTTGVEILWHLYLCLFSYNRCLIFCLRNTTFLTCWAVSHFCAFVGPFAWSTSPCVVVWGAPPLPSVTPQSEGCSVSCTYVYYWTFKYSVMICWVAPLFNYEFSGCRDHV